MNLIELFIKRPVLSIVFNCLFIVIGILGYRHLTIREYPNISLPILTVHAFYPFASPEVVESEVTFRIENVLSGTPGLDTMLSNTREGGTHIQLIFNPGVPIDTALSTVRDRLALTHNLLPKEVKEPTIERAEFQHQAFLYLSVTNPNLAAEELVHESQLYISNQLKTIKGVSSTEIHGQYYTMHILLDPVKMFTYGINPEDVSKAISTMNVRLPAGKFHKEITITLDTSLNTQEDFENIILKSNGDVPVFLKDIAEVKLQGDPNNLSRVNQKPGVLIGISKTNDANPLEISNAIHQLLPTIQHYMPKGTRIEIISDHTLFIRASLQNIARSIVEAILLVLLIIYLFLGNFRATFIPLITLPISLVGSLFIMYVFGFSINVISLMAIILAVGLVVDDAIVVLENIHRHMEEGLSPWEATRKGAKEIVFSILAMTLTLASVYAPIAFIGGTIGQLFMEFAITLAGAVIISGIVALTLSPMMCARILKAESVKKAPLIERYLKKLELKYQNAIEKVLSKRRWMLMACVIIGASTFVLFKIVPKEIAPSEDRGFIGIHINHLPGQTLETFDGYVRQVETLAQQVKEKKDIITFAGDFGAFIGVVLQPFSERYKSAQQVVEGLRAKVANIPSISAHVFSWDNGLPGIQSGQGELSSVSFSIKTIGSYAALDDQITQIMNKLNEDGVLKDIYTDLSLDAPGLRAKVDRKLMAAFGLTSNSIASTLETLFSQSQPVNFSKDNLSYTVTLENAASPDNIEEIYITTPKGERVSLGTLVQLKPVALPTELTHTDQLRSATITASFEGKMTVEKASRYMEKTIHALLPSDFIAEPSGAGKIQKEFSSTLLLLFLLAIVFIYSVLAIQFESFMDPFIILLTVPLACVGALLALWLSGQSLNIFSQIGIITLVGLIAKHGILIVDFANKHIEAGEAVLHAIKAASLQRLRPILMTTAAMVLGTVPLVLSSGAGSESRKAIGTVLVFGLLFGTLFTLFVIPSIYLMVKMHKSPKWLFFVLCLPLLVHSTPSYAFDKGIFTDSFSSFPSMPVISHTLGLLPSEGSSPVIPLEQAINLALQNNEDYLSAQQKITVQEGQVLQTASQLIPSANIASNLPAPFKAPEQNWGYLNFVMPILQLPAVFSLKSSFHALKATQHTASYSQQQLIRETIRNYFTAYTAKQLLSIAESQLERLRDQEKSILRRFEGGIALKIDLDRAKLQVTQGIERLQNAQTNHQMALANLGFLLNQRTQFEITEPNESIFGSIGDQDNLLELALKNRPDLLSQQENIQVAENNRIAAYMDFFPSFTFSTRVPLWNPPAGNGNTFTNTAIFLNANLNIFDGGKTFGQLRAESARVKDQQLQTRKLLRQVEMEVRGQLLELNLRQQNLATLEQTLEVARSTQKSAYRLYENGQATSLDVFNTNLNLFQAEIEVKRAELRLVQARVDLAFAAGIINKNPVP